MCTVTVVPHRDGYRVACNRDERDGRPAATTPQHCEVMRRAAIFPIDPRSAGTWIGVNDAGLTLALLNRYDRGEVAPGAQTPRSRGLIIPSLLGYGHPLEAVEAIRDIDPASYEPFHLVATDGIDVAVASSDSRQISVVSDPLAAPIFFTSSGLGDALVAGPRRALFERMVLRAGDSWLDGQRRFHRHRWLDRPDISVWMARNGARTVSRSVIDVGQQKIAFHYRDLAGFRPLEP